MKNPFRRCPFCNKTLSTNDILCPDCREKINAYNKLPKCAICGQPHANTPLCPQCEKELPKFDLAICLYYYTGIYKESLIDYKFNGQFYKAKPFSGLLREIFEKLGVEIDCITAVPDNLRSMWKRRYNSPLEMAYCLHRMLKKPIYPTLLRKKWRVKQQSRLNRTQRLQNVKNGFLFNRFYQKQIDGKAVLLIDDVITTGATANECARILKKNGAASVYTVTLLGSRES